MKRPPPLFFILFFLRSQSGELVLYYLFLLCLWHSCATAEESLFLFLFLTVSANLPWWIHSTLVLEARGGGYALCKFVALRSFPRVLSCAPCRLRARSRINNTRGGIAHRCRRGREEQSGVGSLLVPPFKSAQRAHTHTHTHTHGERERNGGVEEIYRRECCSGLLGPRVQRVGILPQLMQRARLLRVQR